jgi:hypothetical protein
MTRWTAVLVLLLGLAAPAQGREVRETGRFQIHFEASEGDLADIVSEHIEATAKEVEAKLGLPFDFDVSVWLLTDGQYRRWVPNRQGEWSVAVAWPREGRILLNTGRVNLRNNAYQTLKHELVHLALGRVETRVHARFPLWFHEGVAQWAVGTLFGGTGSDLSLRAAAGTLLPLRDLDAAFPPGGPDVPLAYAESYDVILRLQRVAGEDAVRRVIRGVAEARPFPRAFERVAGRSLARFEEEWARELGGGPPAFFIYLSENPWMVFIVLMAVGAVALGAGYLRYRRRRARILRQWEEEEAMGESP